MNHTKFFWDINLNTGFWLKDEVILCLEGWDFFVEHEKNRSEPFPVSILLKV